MGVSSKISRDFEFRFFDQVLPRWARLFKFLADRLSEKSSLVTLFVRVEVWVAPL